MERGVEKVVLKLRHKFQPEIAKLLLFNGDLGKIAGFVIVCKLYILLQISYSLVVMLELNGILEVQYKEIIIIGDK